MLFNAVIREPALLYEIIPICCLSPGRLAAGASIFTLRVQQPGAGCFLPSPQVPAAPSFVSKLTFFLVTVPAC